MKNLSADVSSEAVEAFLNHLQEFSGQTGQFNEEFEKRLNRLGQTFCDPAYDEFRSAAEQARQKIKHFLQETSLMIPELKKDLDILRETAARDEAAKRSL